MPFGLHHSAKEEGLSAEQVAAADGRGTAIPLARPLSRGVRNHQDLSVHPKSRIMYIENKSGGLSGPARIGRVTFSSKTGKTLSYRDHEFRSLNGHGAGFKANYFDVATGEQYWISGPRRDGTDRLYGERTPIEIDEDVREEYWTEIRGLPNRKREHRA